MKAVAKTPEDQRPLSRDAFSSVASDFASKEDLQLNMALRNSLKDSFVKSSFTPDGKQSIADLRAKRRLFHESDKETLYAKRASYDQSSYDLTMDTPPSSLPSKVNNRLSNNGLDHAYFMSTQLSQDISSPPANKNTHFENQWECDITSPPAKKMTRIEAKWEQKLRIETIRIMQLSNSDPGQAEKARGLYRVLTRKQPHEQYSDVHSIATDCDHTGMTVEDTVKLMINMV